MFDKVLNGIVWVQRRVEESPIIDPVWFDLAKWWDRLKWNPVFWVIVIALLIALLIKLYRSGGGKWPGEKDKW